MKNAYSILIYRSRDEEQATLKARIDWGPTDSGQRVYVGPCLSEGALMLEVAAEISKAEGRADYTYACSKLFKF